MAHSVQRLDDQVPITSDALLDIEWWLQFASSWNGEAFFSNLDWMPPDQFQLYTYASGTLNFRLRCLLGRVIVLSGMVSRPNQHANRTVCHCHGMRVMGQALGWQAHLIPL